MHPNRSKSFKIFLNSPSPKIQIGDETFANRRTSRHLNFNVNSSVLRRFVFFSCLSMSLCPLSVRRRATYALRVRYAPLHYYFCSLQQHPISISVDAGESTNNAMTNQDESRRIGRSTAVDNTTIKKKKRTRQ